MNILAIDTATEYLSLAVNVEGKISTVFEKVDNKHANNLIPYIQQILKEQDLAISDLNLIAYNQGPGSFTGLRIGLSVALGIAYGLDIKLMPIPAFMLHAAKFLNKNSDSQKVIIGLDARLGQMYYAGVVLPEFSYFIHPQLINPQDVCISGNVILCGNGFEVYKDQLPTEITGMVSTDYDYPGAEYMIKLINSGKFKAIDPANADLLYLRNKVALNLEEQKLAKAK